MCIKHASFTYTVTREIFAANSLRHYIFCELLSLECSLYYIPKLLISTGHNFCWLWLQGWGFWLKFWDMPRIRARRQPLPLPILDMPTCIPLFSPPWQRRMLLSRSLGQSPPRLGAAALANSPEDQPFSRKQLWSKPHCDVFIVDLI